MTTSAASCSGFIRALLSALFVGPTAIFAKLGLLRLIFIAARFLGERPSLQQPMGKPVVLAFQ